MTSSSEHSAVVARLLHPDDANIAGNVHGGTILRLMEEGALIAVTRYLLSSSSYDDASTPAVAALVRFENMSFHQPVFVGEVASISAHVVFTSPHSILVKVVVSAEDLSKGKTRVTNTGQLWYVPLVAGGPNNNDWKKPIVANAPQLPLPVVDDDADDVAATALHEYNQAKLSYETRKEQDDDESDSSVEDRLVESDKGWLSPDFQSLYNSGRTASESEQVLSQIVLPGDCGPKGVAFGGFVMKLMDNAAGCSAFRHCRTNVVTVAISAIDFCHWIRLGDICTIRAKVIYASTKTLEIEVVASVTSMHTIDDGDDTLVAKGRFVFASLDSKGKAIPVPPLKLESIDEFKKAYLGQMRYAAAKKARAEAASLNNKTK